MYNVYPLIFHKGDGSETYITGGTYSNGTLNLIDNNGGNISITGFSVTTTCDFIMACSDLTTAITTGTTKAYFRTPYSFTLTDVRASLLTAQTSGNTFTVDVNSGGTSVLSTKLTIDNTEKTSTTAATPPVLSLSAITNDALIEVDVDQIGSGTAKGLIVSLIGYIT